MEGATIDGNLNDALDILGEQAGLNIYTQISLCFPVPDASSHSAIVETLTNGLERLSTSFPWIAGQVIKEDHGDCNPSTFRIRKLQNSPRLVVKDHRHESSMPTMDVLRQASFPFSMLDEGIIAPRNTLPTDTENSSDSAPVFLIQANFIVDGLVLTLLSQHQTMDMTGQGQMMHLLSKACHNEQFTREELSSGNLARQDLITLLDDPYNHDTVLAYQVVKPKPSRPDADDSPEAPSSSPNSTWAYFDFDPYAVSDLKSIATKKISRSAGYISTDDAVSAFVWQSVSRARVSRLKSTTEVTLARAVDVRRYLDVPETYPGLLQNMTYHTYPLQALIEEPLGAVASHLRSAVDPKTSKLAHNTRALTTFFKRATDKSAISVTAGLELSADIMVSSWAKINCYELDFNLGLGKPEAVRRPRFVPCESLISLMPRRPDGKIAVAICLRDEDMERLQADEEFTKYARYIG